MKTKILLFGMAFALMTIGCSKKDSSSNSGFTPEEAGVNAKMDIANDDVSKVVEDQLTTQDGVSSKTASVESYLPACATVTRVPAVGTTLTIGDIITKTIDFGTTGCPLANGNILKGKIIITFTYQPNATSHTINYQFDNFYHNAIGYNGNKSFTRTMTAGTAASPSHPIVVMLMDMTATFPNGNVYIRTGTRTREITAGYDTAILSDNVYKVTGNWTTTFPNTTVQTSEITSPLIVKLSCSNIVQGIITYMRNGNTATLDYGNGDCDNQAVFTINGVAHNITLGN